MCEIRKFIQFFYTYKKLVKERKKKEKKDFFT